MEFFENKDYLSLKEAGEIFGYHPDYLSFLLRTGRIKGKKVHTNSFWQTTVGQIAEYCRKRKKEVADISLLDKTLDKKIKLEEAASISGYHKNYIAQLLREGKIEGKKISAQPSWQVTAQEIKKYKSLSDKHLSETDREKSYLSYVPGIKLSFSDLSRSFAITALAFGALLFISETDSIHFLQGAVAGALNQTTEKVDFYGTVAEGEWDNPEGALGAPELSSGDGLNSFSISNSAVYKSGALDLVVKDFNISEDDEIDDREEFQSAKIKLSLAVGEGEPDIKIDGSNSGESVYSEQINFLGRIRDFFDLLKERLVFIFRFLARRVKPIVKAEDIKEETFLQLPSLGDGEQVLESGDAGYDSASNGEWQAPILENARPSTTEEEQGGVEGGIGELPKTVDYEETGEALDFSTTTIVGTTTEAAKSQTSEHSDDGQATTTEEMATGTEFLTEISTTTEPTDTKEAEETEQDILPELDTKIVIYWSLDGTNWNVLDEVSSSETSNYLNGGYFRYDAYFLNSWEDIRKLQIKIEGATGGQDPKRVYLDSVWAEVEFIAKEVEIVEDTEGVSDENKSDETDIKESVTTTDGITPGAGQGGGGGFFQDEPFNKTWIDDVGGQDPASEENIEEEAKEQDPGSIGEVGKPEKNEQEDIEKEEAEKEEAEKEEEGLEELGDVLEDQETTTTEEEVKEEDDGTRELERISSKKYFKADERPEFKMKYKKKEGVFSNWGELNIKGILRDPEGNILYIQPEISFGENGEFLIKLDKLRSFTPGLYRLTIEVSEAGNIYQITQEFAWGVLAVNTNKSIYLPGEEVYIQMAALNSAGGTLCDANLKLEVTPPNAAPSLIAVYKSGECEADNVVDVPDYFSYYQAGIIGRYQMNLTNLDTGYEIQDAFYVQDSILFDVERIGPTRIWPKANYEMRIKIKANQDYQGKVIERVPLGFKIIDWNQALTHRTLSSKQEKELTWNVSLRQGEQIELIYTFDAPNISPQIFLLGPLRIGDFQEERQWQVASDQTENMILFWDSASSIPNGWSCQSCGSGDFYQKFVMGSSTYGVTGGTSTHSHTASGNVGNGSGANSENSSGDDINAEAHSHTLVPTVVSTSSLPSYRQLRVISYDTAGEPSQMPAGAIAIFDSTPLPANWDIYSSHYDYYIYGEDTPATTGGSNTHRHLITGTTGSSATGTLTSRGGGAQITAAAGGHTHTITSNTGYVNQEPSNIRIILGKLNTTSSPPNDMISMWDDTPPTGWDIVSGAGQDFEGKFIRASSTYDGSTSRGGSSHSHSNVTGITTDQTAGTNNARSGSTGSSDVHTHSVDVTGFSTDDHLPPYVTVIFAKRNTGGGSGATLNQRSFIWQNDDGNTVNSNSNSASADASLEMEKGERATFRVQIDNTGDAATTTSYKLQFAAATSTCSDIGNSNWADISPSTAISFSWGLAGSNNASITTTTTDTTSSCGDGSCSGFATGAWHEWAATTSNFTLTNDYNTEFGFTINTSRASTGTAYCLRIYNNGLNKPLNNYSSFGQLSIVSTPTKKYSKETSTSSLPLATSSLTYYLDNRGYSAVASDDNVNYDTATSSAGYPIFLFARKHTNATDAIDISWDGQSNVACETNKIYLQIYNTSSTAWETLASSTSCATDTDFTLQSTISTTTSSEYYDSDNWNYARVYQASGTQSLKTDRIAISVYSPAGLGLNQRAFIFENDDGNDVNSNSDMFAANATATDLKKGQRFIARFQIDNSGEAATNTYKLQYDKRDGQWIDIDYGGSPDINSGSSFGDWNATTVVSSLGDFPINDFVKASIAVGIDGNLVISYKNVTADTLSVLKCGNPSCTYNNTTNTIDTGSGYHSSIAIGIDGNPVISYWDMDNDDLKFVKCGNPSCGSGNSILTLDSADSVGQYNSIAIGTDGRPVIAYFYTNLVTNSSARVAKCNSGDCTSINDWTTSTVEATDSGQHISIAIGIDGNPILAYRDWNSGTGNLEAVKCNDPACSGGNETHTTLEVESSGCKHTSIAIGTDGNPVISYSTNADAAKVAKCGNASCTSNNVTTTIDTSNGGYTSIVIGEDGNPIITYHDESSDDLKIAKCSNPSCTSVLTTRIIDQVGDVGRSSSVTIGWDGWPVISYLRDSSSDDLKVAKMRPLVEIQPAWGLSGTSTDVLNATQTGDCYGGTTWQNGEWYEATNVSASIILGANKCTELAFVLDVSEATVSTTYRLRLVKEDGTELDSYVAYPAFTIVDNSANTKYYSKENVKTSASSCDVYNWDCSTVDSQGSVGKNGSIAIGTDGLPVASYYDDTSDNLMVVKCGNPSCTSGNTTTTVDETGSVGDASSIVIGADGFPVISYFDATNNKINIAKCGNPSCTSGNTTTSIASATRGTYVWKNTSIAIGTDGNPAVAYFDGTAEDLLVAKCGNPSCTSGNTTSSVDSTGDTGHFPSIAIGTDGNPVISYGVAAGLGDYSLLVAKCGNPSCTSGNTINTLTSGGGAWTGIAVGVDGYPVIVYMEDFSDNDLHVAKCNDTACSGGDENLSEITTVDANFYSIAIGTDGNPVISYHVTTDDTLRIVECDDIACSGGGEVITVVEDVGTEANSGGYSSVAVGSDGNLVVGYYDDDNDNLKIAKQLSLPKTAIGHFNNYIKTDRQTKMTRNQWTSATTGAMWIESSPAIESGLQYKLDKAGYSAVNSDDTSYDVVTSTASSTPVFNFTDRHSSNTQDIYVRWKGQSTVGASANNIVLQLYRFGDSTTTTGWVTTTINSSCLADSGCIITGSVTTTLSDYYFPEYKFNDSTGTTSPYYYTYWRIFQEQGAQTLKTNSWEIQNDDFTYYITQRAYVFENDDGGDVNSNSDMATANATATDVRKGQRLVARFQLDNTASDYTSSYKIQYDKRDGQWVDIDYGGAPNINQGASSSDWNATTVDSSANDVGIYSSIAIGTDGNPVLAYFDETIDDIMVLKCGNPSCTAGNTTSSIASPSDNPGNGWTSLAIGTSSNPIVSYTSGAVAGSGLFVVTCGDPSCSTGNSTVKLDTFNSNTNSRTSIAIGADGFPVISYHDVTSVMEGNLMFAKCTSGDCTQVDHWTTTTVDSSAVSTGLYSSIAIGVDGLPAISYHNGTDGNLNFAKCTSNNCTSSADWSTTTLDTAGDVGKYTHLSIGIDGLPVTSYFDDTNNNLNFAKCTSNNCTSSADWSTTTLDTAGDVGYHTSIAIGTDGNPVISYQDNTNNSVKMIKCKDPSCSGATSSQTSITINQGSSANFGRYSSITIGTDGWPVISYYDDDNDDLKAAKMRPLVEIKPAWGLSGTSTDTLNATQAGSCYGGTSWQNGEWYEATNTSASINLGAYKCTELAFMLDTSEATVSTTYRLRLVKENGTELDSYISYPALTIVANSTNTKRYSKEAVMTSASNCSSTDWSCVTVDSIGIVGEYAYLAIGTDGNPIISYDDRSNFDLRLLKCGDPYCISGNTTTTLDSADAPSRYSSIAIGLDGLPVISYLDGSYNISVIKCGNPSCNSGNVKNIITNIGAGGVNINTRIAIGADGNPVISYYDSPGIGSGNLMVAKCGDPSCSSGNEINTVDSTGEAGTFSSIAIGADGNPVISYYDVNNGANLNLKFAKCGDSSCNSGNQLVTIDEQGTVGSYTSIAIGTDGYPVISYYDGTNNNLNFAKCTSSDCTVSTDWATTTIDEQGTVGIYTSIAIGTDGYPVISYHDDTDDSLKLARCTTGDCTQKDDWVTTTIGSMGHSGVYYGYTSVAIGTDGYPIIAYFDEGNYDLLVAKKLGLPQAAVSYFNNYIKTDRQIKITRTSFPIDNATTGAMWLESSPAIEDGLLYKFDKADYTASQVNDTSYSTVTSTTGSSTSSPVFVFADKHSNNTNPLYARWIGRSTEEASASNFKLEIYRWGIPQSNPDFSYSCNGGVSSCKTFSCSINSQCNPPTCSDSSCPSISNASVSSNNCVNQTPDGDCNCCFSGGTLVTMADGSYKKIKDVEIGDKILAFDEDKNSLVTDSVKEIWEHSPESTGDYYLVINDELEVTLGHPVYSHNSPDRWIPAGELKEGDQMMNEEGELFVVYSIERIYEKIPTYNIATDKHKTFFASGMLAHNKIPGQCTDSAVNCTGDTGTCDYTCDEGYYNCDSDNSNGCESSDPCSVRLEDHGWKTVTTESSCLANADCTIDGSTTTNLSGFYYPEYKFNDSTGTTSADYWTFWRVYQDASSQSEKVFNTDFWDVQYAQFGEPSSAEFVQRNYIFENDDGQDVNSNSGMEASANTTTTEVKKGQRFIARFQIDNPSQTYSDTSLKLQYDKQDNQWIDVDYGGAPNINSGALSSDWNVVTAHASTTANIGIYSSIAIGADGNPVVSYYDSTDGNLNFLKCGNPSCTAGNTTTTVDETGNVGQYSSIAIGTDGNPVVSYYDVSVTGLNVLKCGNSSCTSGNTTTSVDLADLSGQYNSLAIGTDGNPVISYLHSWFDGMQHYDLMVLKCGNSSCTSGNSTTTIVETGDIIMPKSSIAIGIDGYPVISFYTGLVSNGYLKAYHCTSIDCSTGNLNTVDPGGDVGDYNSIAIGSDGYPVISYQDDGNNAIKIVKCNDVACSGGDEIVTRVDSGSATNFGNYSSIVIGTDGWPVISYYDDDNDDLKVAKMRPLVELQPAWGMSGSSGDDLTSAAAGTCYGGTSWQNGEWYEATTTSQTIILNSNYCTELAFVLDTSEATVSTTYRLRLVESDGDVFSSYVQYPSLKIVSEKDNTARYSKEAVLTSGSGCDVSDYSCEELSSLTLTEATSIAIGTDGNPIIAFYDTGPDTVNVLKCGNPYCSSGNVETVVDSVSDVYGDYISIVIGADGKPIIAYLAGSGNVLKVAKCGNAACNSDNTISTLEITGTSRSLSMAIGTDGNPIISYQNSFNLEVAKCNNPSCSSYATSVVEDIALATGRDSSIAIGSDGLPVIAYYTYGGEDEVIMFAKCGDASCSSGNVTTTIGSSDDGYTSISMAIGTDGLPVITYYASSTEDGTDSDYDLLVCKCGNSYCNTGNTTTTVVNNIFSYLSLYAHNSIAIGVDGNPTIVASASTTGYVDLVIINCNNSSCSSFTSTTVMSGSGSFTPYFASIAVGNDGYSAVSYYDTSGDKVGFIKQLGLPKTAISYFNNSVKTDRQIKLTRNQWALATTGAMWVEASPSIEDGLIYKLDKEGYTAIATDDTSYDWVTSTASSSPAFVFTDKSSSSTRPIYVRWRGQSTVAASTNNIALQLFRFGDSSTTTGWVTTTINTSCVADSDCIITGSVTTTLSDYYFPDYKFNDSTGITSADYWTFWRIYQEQGSQSLKSDQWQLQYEEFGEGATSTTISGVVYSNEGSTGIGSGKAVTLKVNGTSTQYTTTTATSSYLFYNVPATTTGDIITVFIDGETEKAVTVTRSAGADISGLDIYQNRVIVRHEDSGPITNSNLNQYDGGNDSDIKFTSDGTSLTVSAGNKLYIWPNKNFSPGGAVTINGNAQASPDGDLHIATGATYSAGATTTLAGSWIASSSATFTHNNYAVVFTATTTGKQIITQGTGNPFYNVIFSGSSGGATSSEGWNDPVSVVNDSSYGSWAWSSTSKATSSDDKKATVTLGPYDVSNYLKATDFNFSIPDGSTITGISVEVERSATSTFQIAQIADIRVRIVKTGSIGSTNKAKAGTWGESDFYQSYGGEGDLWGESWTPSDINSSNTGMVIAVDNDTGTGGGIARVDHIRMTVYYTESSSQGGWTFASGDHRVLNNFTITAGTVTSTSGTLQVGGSWSNSGIFNATSGTVTFNDTNGGKTINPGSSSFNVLTFDGSGGGWQLLDSALDVDNNLNITNGTLDASSRNINLAGNLTLASGGLFTKGSGTFTFDDSGTNTWSDSNVTKQDLGTVTINGSSKTINLNSDVKATELTIESGNTLGASSYAINITGSGTGASRPFIVSGTFNYQTSLVDYTSTSTTDVEAATYYNLRLSQSGSNFQLYNDATTTNDLNIAAGTLDVTTDNYNLWVGGNWTNSATFTSREAKVFFTATSTGKTITTGDSAFSQLEFDGSGGQWTFLDSATSTATTTMTQGVVRHGGNNDLVLSSMTIQSNATFTKATGTGALYFEDSEPIFIEDVNETNNLGDVYIGFSPATTNQNSDIVVDSLTVNSGDSHNTRGYEIDCAGDITVYGTLNATDNKEGDLTNIFVGGSWTVSGGIFTHGNSTTTFDATSTNKTITDGGYPFHNLMFNGVGGSWFYTDSTSTEPNSVTVQNGTSTFVNAKTGNNISVTGGQLNVDWYLGIHTVALSSTSTDIGNATCTVQEKSSAPQSTVWKMSSGSWGTASTSRFTVTQNTGTATGTNPQPSSDGALRIREYSQDLSTTTYYQYNLEITVIGFTDYDYYADHGSNYLTSASSTESSGVDKAISQNWYRATPSSLNGSKDYDGLNEPPLNGTWYAGLGSDLEFSVDSSSVDIGTLNELNAYTSTNTTMLYATTSYSGGYTVKAYASNNGRLVFGGYYIQRWPYSNSSPAAWSGTCEDNTECGFGYTTDDNDLAGGTSSRFNNATNYAGFATSTPGDIMADETTAVPSGSQHTITYKASVAKSKEAGTYNTTVYYICTANY